MSLTYNYRHLYYFWIVAQEGGMSNAAARLGTAVQTVSAQVRELEKALGCQLLKPVGRGVALTEAGVLAARQAQQIFELGEALPTLLRQSALAPRVRLAVGMADGLPKLEVLRLLRPVLDVPDLHLICHDGEIDDLLAELATHRLDVVLTDHPVSSRAHLKVHHHRLASSAYGWFAAPPWLQAAQRPFPASLQGLPLLLPTRHASVRAQLDQWLARHGLTPRIAGEFEDSALLETFGGQGMGVFPAALALADTLQQRHGALLLGVCEGVAAPCYALSLERRVAHPLLRRLLEPGA